MALSNAEKQAAFRERQAKKGKFLLRLYLGMEELKMLKKALSAASKHSKEAIEAQKGDQQASREAMQERIDEHRALNDLSNKIDTLAGL